MRISQSLLRSSHAFPLTIALLLTAAVYIGALGTFFAQDDITFLARAAGLETGAGVFRALSSGLMFRSLFAIFGLSPLGYHVVNLALHLLNVAGVYALTLRLGGRRETAVAAAALFGCSSIAFTPLHWAAGVVEILTGTLLLGAALLHLESIRRGSAWRWAASLVALAAMFSKEISVAWVLVVVLLEWTSKRRPLQIQALLPSLVLTSTFVLIVSFRGGLPRPSPSDAYALSASPSFLVQNLFTYVKWCAALWEPIRDRMATADPGAWRLAVPICVVIGVAILREPRDAGLRAALGVGWWLAFLVPVLPLVHHTYLYYLYLPWIGGAIAIASLGEVLLARWPSRTRTSLGLAALGGYVLVEAHNIDVRRTATRDALPVDRTIRDAMLLRHALPALRAARLAPGTGIAFVNPVPRARFDLITSAPTRPEDQAKRASYFPLEAAMRGGETLRLFEPQVVYRGFSRTIPSGWEDTEWFYFEQRGWLERWGRGQDALMHQAQVQMASRRWAEAESTFLRVRALGDTLPSALEGQLTALFQQGKALEAGRVEGELARRWPRHPAPRNF